MKVTTDQRTSALRAWARGDLALEAAVELLIGALDGRLLAGPWIRRDGDIVYFDPEIAASESGYLSGGERRVLAIACSLADDGQPVDLGDAITGIDHDALATVLKALAHAGGLPMPDPLGPAGVEAQSHGLRASAAKRRPASHEPAEGSDPGD